MRKFISCVIAACMLTCATSPMQAQSSPLGNAYWQQQVNTRIDVSLNDKKNELDGFERIEYINHSPDTLRSIWFHIWPNAYKNDKTAFSDQMLENGNTKFYFSNADDRGYINRLEFKINNVTADMRDHPHYIDIVEVVLPTPLAPGATAMISTPFHVKIPAMFSRFGHIDQRYYITQWFPKPAVYDRDGWHAFPYLDQGEFYAEFGDYDVSITTPKNYVVAATGALQDADEKQWLRTRTSFNWTPRSKKMKTKGGGYRTVKDKAPPSSIETKTLRFIQKNVHDFAWFADKEMIVAIDTCALPSGRIIDAYCYFTPSQQNNWKPAMSFLKEAIHTRSAWIGDYPYDVVSIVQGPGSNTGGMEYPTIALISSPPGDRLLGYTINHEVGHNWFYAALGSNERAHPWLDEGLNTYYDNRYSALKYHDGGEIKFGSAHFSINDAERILFDSKAAQRLDQPINLPSEAYTDMNYNLSSYYKTGAWLDHVAHELGTDAFNRAMSAYYAQWQYKHPQPADLKSALERSTGRNLDSSFSLLDREGELPNEKRHGISVGFPFSPAFISQYLHNPSKSVLLLSPAVGYNKYDKIMVGALVTNIFLPASPLQFLAVPLYSFNSRKLSGTDLINYSLYPKHGLHRVDIGVAGSMFTTDDFTDDENVKTRLRFHKIVPGVRITLAEKNARSTIEKYIQFKSFFIGEDALRFYRDTVVTAGDTTISTKYRTVSQDRTLNQLQFVIENFRALYPYRAELCIEQGKDFARIAFTGKYFFNYNVTGGLDVRFFAGKFLYTGAKTISKQFATDRYQLNMTGANGYEDYTYSDYFVGRNEFEGAASQQIMERDGAFKVRTDLLASKVGKTDDWLIAANFSTSTLSGNFPIHLFADVGTYAEAWDRNANTDRFLFDFGIHVPLLKKTVNVYLPLIYSKVYKDYIKSTIEKKGRIWKTVSFSIDMSNFSFRKINRNLSF